MDYYYKAREFEKNDDLDKAKYFYELSYLFGFKIAAKHLEYLDKDKRLDYSLNYMDHKINPDFIEILCFWYDNVKYFSNFKNFYTDITTSKIEELWDNIWFAKGNKQKNIDEKLNQFTDYYDKYKEYKPKDLYEYIALIILYDQIPRNIFRNTSKAYETDLIAYNYAKYLGKFIDILPVHISIPIIMSHIHCESLEILNITKEYLKKIKNKVSININNSINGIFRNHYDRISLFGRIPERNKFIGRESSEKELVYLQNL